MKRLNRTLTALCCVVLLTGLCGGPAATALGADLMLREAPTSPRTFAWGLLGMSVVSLGVAANAYTQSQDALDEADSYHADYQAAATESEANRLHRKTRDALDDAQAFESTANGGIALGVLLGLAAWYAFTDTYDPDPPLLLTAQPSGVGFLVRF